MLWTCLIIAVIVTSITAILLGLTNSTHKNVPKASLYMFVLIFIVTTVTALSYKNKAGADTWPELAYYLLNPNTVHTLVQSDLPEEGLCPGDIIVYYKFGCTDCEMIHEDLAKHVHRIDNGRIFYVETQSKKGQKILARYPVSQVPALVLIQSNDMFHYEDPGIQTETGYIYDPQKLELLLQEREQMLEPNDDFRITDNSDITGCQP